jgi:hypothetical protein
MKSFFVVVIFEILQKNIETLFNIKNKLAIVHFAQRQSFQEEFYVFVENSVRFDENRQRIVRFQKVIFVGKIVVFWVVNFFDFRQNLQSAFE